ncbi:MAG: outer membrane protein transport protein [Nitratireductor sp.]|nr:outer membrane protein transport protein [Nitratireductor sp.]MCC0019774.1 outer membrane protein transport protein [Nitratireductor sp.]
MNTFAKSVVAGLSLSLLAGAAHAGGYNRGSANLDGLYSDALGIVAGMTWVSPGRSYDRVSGLVAVNNPGGFNPAAPVVPSPFVQGEVEFGNDFEVPYVSIGGRIADNFNCVGSYAEPYGASSSYSGAMTFKVKDVSLSVKEYGLTCAVSTELEKGRVSLIGGVFYEDLQFNQSRTFPTFMFGASGLGFTGGDSKIDVSSDAWGWRAGLAYEIPEIALRAQLLYRSETKHDLSGSFINTPFTAIFGAAGDLASAAAAAGISKAGAYGSVTLPQQVEFSLQTGIAPGWLAFGSVKWTDWSILREVNLFDKISNNEFTDLKAYYKDGWTVTGGIGHKINDQVSVAGSVTWDKGVTSGWDTLSDTWTYAGSVIYNATENVSIRATAAAIKFTEGSKTKTDSALDYVAHSPEEWGHAFSLQATIKF